MSRGFSHLWSSCLCGSHNHSVSSLAIVSRSLGGTPHCHCGEIVVLRVVRTVENAATLAIFFFSEQPAHSFHSSTTCSRSFRLHRRYTATTPSRRLFRGRRCIFFFFEQPSPLFKCVVRFTCTTAALPLHRRRDCSGAAASSSSLSMKFVVTGSGVLWATLQESATGWVF
ncbi:hypothetical protein DEO72_LG5g2178 [Vigna unguiculata]|uniref:Uncharacterized protein n=1 Tax=Vigna unguiculata TaxID=3917 RepID=A0A4D6LYP9_VIGUN|nr:hypothetical protein DEO72_LG5g2178 [Vigna unguiculata]